MQPSNSNYFSPNKFRVSFHKFPNVEYFAQNVPIPGVTTGSPKRFTSADVDHWLTGDKLEFDALVVSFILDEDFRAFTDIFKWLKESMVKPEDGTFRPYSDMDVIALTNNSNKNVTFRYRNALPISISEVPMTTTASEDNPILCTVVFRYSHYDVIRTNES